MYIAGDYCAYAVGKRADNKDYYSAYMKQLKGWCDSENVHKAVTAIYSYLEKACIVKDLINCGVLKTDPQTGRLDGSKIAGIAQQDAFVRFTVRYDDAMRENRTWLDTELYDNFIAYNGMNMGNKQLCYATGKILPITYKHPSKIRNSGDKAKLISSNDESGFTYRGRFSGKEEALSVSYDFSQKMHNALKWLIANQGISIENSFTLIVWASSLQPVPDVTKSFTQSWQIEFAPEINYPSTESQYAKLVKDMIFGYNDKLDINTKVMVMGLDAATVGRLSIGMYTELDGSGFLGNLEKWHSQTAWMRYKKDLGNSAPDSFSVYEIVECAYGTEQNGMIKCKPEVMKDIIVRLGTFIKICDDGKLYMLMSLPEGVTQDEIDKAVSAGVIKLMDGAIADEPMNWELRDGEFWFDTGIEGEVYDEKVSSWVKPIDENGFFNFMNFRFIKED